MAVQIPFATISQIHQDTVVEDIFFTGLLQQCQVNQAAPQWLIDIRQQSKSWLSRLSVPTRKDEDWRFIDLSSLTAGKFVSPQNVGALRPKGLLKDIVSLWYTASHIASRREAPLPETENNRLVFINGIYNDELSNLAQLPQGIYVGSLNNLPDNYDAAKYFAQQSGADAFTALNTAGGDDVAVVWIDKNVVAEKRIHLIFIADGKTEASFAQPRTLVVAEIGSSVSLIEEYIGTGEYFTNAVTEIFVQNNARVNHTRLQQESDASYHIGKTAVSQERDSHYTLNEINLGAKLCRHNPEMWQQGEQTETNLNGLTVA
ncbi:MAG: hypothetical protein RLZZ574_608, partial [Cyanobacteriota bacterium]